MAAGEVLGNGNSSGTNFGRSTDKIGFYGLTTPIVQPTGATAVATTAAVSSSTTIWGYSTSTQADAIVTGLNVVIANLKALNLTT